MFVAYPFGTKGYKVLDLVTKRIHVSRHVKFFENIFPFSLYPKSAPRFFNPYISSSFPISKLTTQEKVSIFVNPVITYDSSPRHNSPLSPTLTPRNDQPSPEDDQPSPEPFIPSSPISLIQDHCGRHF